MFCGFWNTGADDSGFWAAFVNASCCFGGVMVGMRCSE